MEDHKARALFGLVAFIILVPIIGLQTAADRMPVLLTLIAGVALGYGLYNCYKIYRLRK